MSTFDEGLLPAGDWVLDRTEEKREYERRAEEYWERYRREPRSRGPWLLIRAFATDIGIRLLPGNTCAYLSPDVSAISSDGGPITRGVPAKVSARVWNLGAFSAIQTRVDFYWGNPAAALTVDQLNHIGTAFVTVNSMSSTVVECPNAWTPTYVNGGHECLIVRCSCPPFDPASALIDPWSSRHVGQRNIWVVEPNAESLNFEILAGNPLAEAADMDFSIRAYDIDQGDDRPLKPVDLAFALQSGAMPWQVEYPEGSEASRLLRNLGERVPRSPKPPRYESVDVAAELTRIVQPAPNKQVSSDTEETFRVLKQRRLLGPEPSVEPTFRAQIEPHEMLGIRVEQPKARPGRAIVTHVTQMYGGVVIGGYAAVTSHNDRRQ